MIGKFCVASSYAIIYLYSSELFPTSVRNSLMGSCSMMARIGSMLAPLIISIGDWQDLPFFVFGISGIIGSFSAIMLPETLNRNLPEGIKECERISKFGISFKYNGPDSYSKNNKQTLEEENVELNKE
jgi:MFS family permease